MQVSGSPGSGYDGTYLNDGVFNDEPSWRLPGQAAYIWRGVNPATWYVNEWKGQPVDNDNAAYQQLGAADPTGNFVWFELQHATVTVPVCAGSYYFAGIYHGWPYFTQGAPDWYLWRHPDGYSYQITNTLGLADGAGDDWWLADVINNPNTTFTHQGTATGDPDFAPVADDTCTVARP